MSRTSHHWYGFLLQSWLRGSAASRTPDVQVDRRVEGRRVRSEALATLHQTSGDDTLCRGRCGEEGGDESEDVHNGANRL